MRRCNLSTVLPSIIQSFVYGAAILARLVVSHANKLCPIAGWGHFKKCRASSIVDCKYRALTLIMLGDSYSDWPCLKVIRILLESASHNEKGLFR
jgi:hypothetical protein